MLLYSGLCVEYVKCLRALRRLVGNNASWDPTTLEFRLHSAPFKRTIVICLFFFVTQNIHMMTTPDNERDNKDDIGYVFSAMFILISLYSLEMIRNKETMETLISGLLSFEQRYCDKGQALSISDRKKLKSAKRACATMELVGFGPVGFALGIIAIMLPMSVMNVLAYPPGSWLVSCMESLLSGLGLHKILILILVKGFVIFGNLFVFTVGYGSGVTLCTQILATTKSISVAISVFAQRLNKLTSNKTSYLETSSEAYIQRCQRTIQIYREIQLLTLYFNQMHSNVLVGMMATAVMGQVVSAVALIAKRNSAGGSGSDIEQKAIALFLLAYYTQGMTLCVICLIVIFGSCADVYELSNKYISYLRRSETMRKSKMLRRIVRSLPTVRVTFGRTNFVDQLSPVVYQQFTNEKIIDTLLLQK